MPNKLSIASLNFLWWFHKVGCIAFIMNWNKIETTKKNFVTVLPRYWMKIKNLVFIYQNWLLKQIRCPAAKLHATNQNSFLIYTYTNLDTETKLCFATFVKWNTRKKLSNISFAWHFKNKNTDYPAAVAVSRACDSGAKGFSFEPRTHPSLWSKSRHFCELWTDRQKSPQKPVILPLLAQVQESKGDLNHCQNETPNFEGNIGISGVMKNLKIIGINIPWRVILLRY